MKQKEIKHKNHLIKIHHMTGEVEIVKCIDNDVLLTEKDFKTNIKL